MNTTTETKKDVHSIATAFVIEHLKHRVVPWLNHWTERGMPQNLITHLEYRFLNIFLLANLGFKKNFFITLKQLEEIKGTVKKGEKGFPVYYWKWDNGNDKSSEADTKQTPTLRYYYVYNIDQCDGIKKSLIPKIEVPKNPLQVCMALVANMQKVPPIKHGVNSASYLSILDLIEMPEKDNFPNDESYYALLFRMLVHSTGHESRLNRKEVMEATVTDDDYLRIESLIGELGASYLSSLAGIPYDGSIDVNVYAAMWREKLEKDSRLIIYASVQAQRAVDYILNRKKKEYNG